MNCSRIPTALVALILTTTSVFCQDSEPEPIDRKVFVTEAGAEIRIPDGVVWRCYPGEVFRVTLLTGEWLWVPRKSGWLWIEQTVPFESCIEHFTALVERDPTGEAFHQRGLACMAHSRYAEAIEDFTETIRRLPRNSGAYNNRGNGWKLRGDAERALADYSTAIQIDPENAWAYNNRALIRIEQGALDAAMRDLDAATTHNKEYTEAWNNRGVVWRERGEYERAIADYSQALAVDGRYAVALGNRGFAWKQLGKLDAAIEDYSKAVQYAPQSRSALNDLAWLLATCSDDQYRNGERAVELAKNACELSDYGDWNELDTLAAACAEVRKFADAIKWIEKALDIAPQDQRRLLRQRLAAFQNSQTVREGV